MKKYPIPAHLLILWALWLVLPSKILYAEDGFARGIYFLQTQRFDDAIEAFSHALKSDPENVMAYNNRGICWFFKGDADRALADYTRALEINPLFSEAYINRGEIWVSKGLYKRAIVDYTVAIDIDPSDAEAYYHRGASWFKKGDCGRAIIDLKKAMDIRPNTPVFYNQMAWILAVCPKAEYRNGQTAVVLATEAVKSRPEASTLDTLAAAYAESGNFEAAIKTQERVIQRLEKEGKNDLLPESLERLESYKGKKPWREKWPGSELEIRIAVFLESWRKAWIRADVNAYSEFYDTNAAQGRLKGRSDIAEHKRQLWKHQQPSDITLGPLTIIPQGNGYRVEFEQGYTAGSDYRDRGHKTLVLSPRGESWVIIDEKWRSGEE